MKVEVALVELRQVRLIVAFPHESYVRPGVGDDLIERLAKRLPPRGIMLVAEGRSPRAYAHFETDELLPLLLLAPLTRFDVDLDAAPTDEDEDEDDLPF